MMRYASVTEARTKVAASTRHLVHGRSADVGLMLDDAGPLLKSLQDLMSPRHAVVALRTGFGRRIRAADVAELAVLSPLRSRPEPRINIVYARGVRCDL